jgi:hypothetical protein
LQILGDLKLEYTAYYVHYYHLLTAASQQYKDRPNILAKIRDVVKRRIEDKTAETNQRIVEKYALADGEQLAALIGLHEKRSAGVRQAMEIFNREFENLCAEKTELRPVDFELDVPRALTKQVFMQVIQKMFACVRFQLYCAIRNIIRARPQGSAYITKNELRDILGALDTVKLRSDVFKLYGLEEVKEGDLIKAYTSFLIDQPHLLKLRQIKQSHERYLSAILNCDVFPGLEKQDPMSSQAEDVIPDKYGPSWYEHEQKKKENPLQHFSNVISAAQNDEQSFEGVFAAAEPQVVMDENKLLIS